MAKTEPSLDQWLAEAKADPKAAQCGMFLTHNGVVRVTPKKQVREGVDALWKEGKTWAEAGMDEVKAAYEVARDAVESGWQQLAAAISELFS